LSLDYIAHIIYDWVWEQVKQIGANRNVFDWTERSLKLCQYNFIDSFKLESRSKNIIKHWKAAISYPKVLAIDMYDTSKYEMFSFSQKRLYWILVQVILSSNGFSFYVKWWRTLKFTNLGSSNMKTFLSTYVGTFLFEK
jgi:hypothetical protein